MVLLAMLVSVAMWSLLAIVPLPLSLLRLKSILGMIALDHPGMVLLALTCLLGRVFFAIVSVSPVDIYMSAVLTPTLCRMIIQVGVHTVCQDLVE